MSIDFEAASISAAEQGMRDDHAIALHPELALGRDVAPVATTYQQRLFALPFDQLVALHMALQTHDRIEARREAAFVTGPVISARSYECETWTPEQWAWLRGLPVREAVAV